MSPDPLVSSRTPRAESPGPRGIAGAWGWTALAVVLGTALPFWPYAHACGWRLWLYCGAVFVLFVAGGRAALAAWHDRVGLAHTVALLASLWALALGVGAVLPRVHYAKTAATWSCGPAMTRPQPAPGNATAAPRESTGAGPGASDSTKSKSQDQTPR